LGHYKKTPQAGRVSDGAIINKDRAAQQQARKKDIIYSIIKGKGNQDKKKRGDGLAGA